ncbi:MAG: 3-isopropylmalate dehydratase small subunit [Hyphomonadaceae bacterium]|nr:3-isopropylmalate dehydratase small subunit [Hyphomonadaceae bacterium]
MAEPFTRLTSQTIVVPQASIDTDQIIPARFLTTTTRYGLGKAAFYDWRYDANGAPIADAQLNNVDTKTHKILVAGDNFACGSSREHAPWALLDFGIRAVISTSVADIFTSNALKNGLLPIEVDAATHKHLLERPDATITIDLIDKTLTIGNDKPIYFKVEPFARRCLIDGVSPLEHLLRQVPALEKFERENGLGS